LCLPLKGNCKMGNHNRATTRVAPTIEYFLMLDWRTEEEEWDVAPPTPTIQDKPARRWPFWLLLAVLLLAGLGLSYRQITGYLAQVDEDITADITTSHALLTSAQARGDWELLQTILSGRERGWIEGQRLLLQGGHLFDRRPFGLAYVDDVNETAALHTTLSADLNEAELTQQLTYRPQWFNENDAAIQLEQTWYYRRGDNRWLLAPFPADFWGEWRVSQSQRLSLAYPARDADLAERLLADLDAELARACHTLANLGCPANINLYLRFDTNPVTLARSADPAMMLNTVGTLDLPTPTLIGRPQNEAAYQWLKQGYAAHLIAAAITELVGYRCCEQGLFYQALLDRQLNTLGLRPWPMTAESYATLLSEPVIGVQRMDPLWTAPPQATMTPERRQVLAAVDYWLQNETAVPAEMQRHLQATAGYWSWSRRYGGDTRSFLIQRDWLEFVHRQAAAANPPRPDWPEQEIQLMCKDGPSMYAHLYRYDVASDTWQQEIRQRQLLFMAPLPDAGGVLLQERVQLSGMRNIIWENGAQREGLAQPLRGSIFRADPVAGPDERMLVYAYDFAARQSHFRLLDLTACGDSGCELTTLTAPPVWSPDGNASLLWPARTAVWLGDELGQPQQLLAEMGAAPFWLDADTPGWITPDGVVVLDADNLAVLLPLSRLQERVPAALSHLALNWQGVAVAPGNGRYLFLLAGLIPHDPLRGVNGLLFRYDRSGDELTLLWEVPHDVVPYYPLRFSPDGQWLLLKSNGPRLYHFYLYHVESGQERIMTSNHMSAFPNFDWSADGRWLLRLEQGFVHLSAPAEGYQTLLLHEFNQCQFAAWVRTAD
jgi:hypothetical protein